MMTLINIIHEELKVSERVELIVIDHYTNNEQYYMLSEHFDKTCDKFYLFYGDLQSAIIEINNDIVCLETSFSI